LTKKISPSRVSTGVHRLDKLLEGGFPSETSILLSGNAGSGKTLFALNVLLEGAKKGEKCYYLSLSENTSELLRATQGIKPLKAIDRYLGKNLKVDKVDLGPELALKQFVNLFSVYPDIDRLVVDNLNKLLIFAETKREYRMHLSEIISYLKQKVKCALLLCETDDDRIDTKNGESFEVDGVVHISFLDLEEKPLRTLELTKMRYTAIEPLVKHHFVISESEIGLGKTRVV